MERETTWGRRSSGMGRPAGAPRDALRDGGTAKVAIAAVTFDVHRTLMFNPQPEARRAQRTALKGWLRCQGVGADGVRLRAAIAHAELLCAESLDAGEPPDVAHGVAAADLADALDLRPAAR